MFRAQRKIVMFDVFNRLLLILGYLLLPFSSSPEDGFVLAYGLPLISLSVALLAIHCLIGFQWSYSQVLSVQIVIVAFIFIFVMCISLIYSQHIVPSLGRLIPNLVGFFVFLSVYYLVHIRGYKLKTFEVVLVAFGTILSLYYLTNLFFQIREHGVDAVIVERFTGGIASLPWGASNNISAVLFFSLVSAFICLKSDGRIIWVFAITLISIGILSTLSRTGAVLLVLTNVGMIFLSKRGNAKLLLSLFVVVLLASGSIYWWSIEGVNSLGIMYSDRFSEETLSSGNGRLEIWADKIEYFWDHPFSPIGYYGSLSVLDGVSAHNYFLTVLLEQGIFGLVASFTFLFWPFVFFLFKNNTRSELGKMYMLGLSIVLINLLFEDANFTQPYILVFWLFMASLYNRVLSFPMFGRISKKSMASTR